MSFSHHSCLRPQKADSVGLHSMNSKIYSSTIFLCISSRQSAISTKQLEIIELLHKFPKKLIWLYCSENEAFTKSRFAGLVTNHKHGAGLTSPAK